MIRNSIIKIISLMLIVGLNWAGLSAVGETVAYFFDQEDSHVNNLLAGVLDFELYSPTENFVPPEVVSNMEPGDSVSREISVIQKGNPFKYNALTVKTEGSDEFCDALTLEAELEGDMKYSDGLMSLNFDPPIIIGGDGQDDWTFTVTLPSGSSFPPGEVCRIKFVFDGWQVRFSDSTGGYTDQEEIASSFATGGIKINKVYYDVDSEHGAEIDNEWIEIYNPLENPVDISGWTIEDNNAADIIPASDPIPAQGFAVITANATTWQYWEIPDDVVKIVLDDGAIGGDGLDDNSDRVILKMPGGTEDDAMSYGGDIYAFNPSCPDVAEGHILARIPTGFDTNSASDWQDIGLPSVTLVVPSGGEVWYVGHYYDLEWTATNSNGDDNLLIIDLWYSNDSGNTWANIVKGTYNDGVYNWRVPLFMYDEEGGYYYVPSSIARIKVVAWGPENFMVQNWDMSGDFCPPIDQSLLTPEELAFLAEMGLYEGPIEELVAEEGDGEEALEDPLEEIIETGEETTEDVIEEPIDETNLEEEVIEEDTPIEETEDGGIIEEINEIIDEVIEEIVDEIMPDDETGDEAVSEPEAPIIEETPVIEEAPVEEAPVVEEQPATTPDESSSAPDGSGSVGDGGSGDGGNGETGGSSDSGSPAEGAGESSGDSGSTGDIISE